MVKLGRLTVGAAARIVVFGDVIDDIVVVPAGPIRLDTDTPSSIRQRAGGSAANVASWLGFQGAPVDFVGRVGAVDLPRHEAMLRGLGVTPHLVADAEHPTGSIVVLVEGNHRSMLTERGANAWLTADQVDEELMSRAAVVHFTGYSVFHATDHTPLRRLMERAAARGVVVSVDPASAGGLEDFGAIEFLKIIEGCGMLFPNRDEGRALTGHDDPQQMVSILNERFPLVILTLGADGALVGERGRTPQHVEAKPATVVDPTGAGDAFTAGFLSAWLAGSGVLSAARSAVSLAVRAVETVGGRPDAASLPS